MLSQVFGYAPRIIRTRSRDVDQWQAGVKKCSIHEAVAIPTVSALVGRIIEFDRGEGLHRVWITDDEIDMLTIDAIACGKVFMGAFHIEKVSDTHLDEDVITIADGLLKHPEERELGM